MPIKIENYIESDLISFLETTSRIETLEAMVEMLDRAGKLVDKAAYYQAILDREQLISTGIGVGVAIPHAKLPQYSDFFIAIAILKRGVDWNALDRAPVRIVFMIGGPDNKQTEYLQILSKLTKVINDEERRKKILTANSKNAIISLFE